MKIVVLGAAGGIGQPLSLLLKHGLPSGNTLSLYDIAAMTPGVAKDLSHVPTPARVEGYAGPDLDEALHGASVVLIPAGMPRKPGMVRAELIQFNASIAAGLVEAVARVCPRACLGIITNPVNTIVPMAAQILRRAGVYDRRKLFGVTTLDTLRANTFVAEHAGRFPGEIEVRVVGGHSGKTILPLLSQVHDVSFTPEEIAALTHRIREAGTEVVEAKAGAGSATLSMAAAGCRFGLALVRGLRGHPGVVECSYVEGDTGHARFFAQPVRLGVEGVAEFMPIGPMSAYEEVALATMLDELRDEITKGENLEV